MAKRSTRDLIHCVRRLQESAREKKKNIACAFLDFKCAFDMVNRNTLWTLLAKMGVPDALTDIIRQLHTHTMAKVRVGKRESGRFEIKRGVRQGCPTAPILFNLYLHGLMNMAGRQDWEGKDLTNSYTFSTGEFADDIILIGDTQQVQHNLARLASVAKEDGMELSHKTECMWLTHHELPSPPLELYLNPADHSTRVKQVSTFKYLGSHLATNAETNAEVEYRLERARGKIFQLHKLLKDTNLTTHTKDNLVKSVVMPSLLYAVETMPTRVAEKQRFQTLVNGCLRRNRKLTLRDRVPSRRLWAQAKLPPIDLLLAYRRVAWMNSIHMQPADDITRQFTRDIKGSQERGRPRTTWWTSLKQDLATLNLGAPTWPIGADRLYKLHEQIKTGQLNEEVFNKKHPHVCHMCAKRYSYRASFSKHLLSHPSE